jgi:hypothetical protein
MTLSKDDLLITAPLSHQLIYLPFLPLLPTQKNAAIAPWNTKSLETSPPHPWGREEKQYEAGEKWRQGHSFPGIDTLIENISIRSQETISERLRETK